jgi:hypothetical protein
LFGFSWTLTSSNTSGKVSLICLFEFVFLLSFCTFTFTFLYFQVMSFESKPTGLLKTKKKTKKTQKSTDTFPDATDPLPSALTQKSVSSSLLGAAACLTSGAARDASGWDRQKGECATGCLSPTNSFEDPLFVSTVYLLPCSTWMGKTEPPRALAES